MKKYLLGLLTGIGGALVLREAYAKGFNKGVKECSDKIDFIAEVQKIKNKKGEKES